MQFLFGLIIGALAVVAYLASRKPDYFKYTRSIVINAPATAIFPYINNTRAVNSWSPWLALDPTANITYNEIAEGIGATTHWVGNKNIGQGSATIVESNLNESVITRLDFIKPMKATNKGIFQLAEDGGKTTVSWSMEGKNTFPGKVFNVFVDCEKMVGDQFDKGLRNLKARLESAA